MSGQTNYLKKQNQQETVEVNIFFFTISALLCEHYGGGICLGFEPNFELREAKREVSKYALLFFSAIKITFVFCYCS